MKNKCGVRVAEQPTGVACCGCDDPNCRGKKLRSTLQLLLLLLLLLQLLLLLLLLLLLQLVL